MKQCTLNRYMLTLLFSSVFVYAQGSNGSITGTITDANGASVPAATVEAKEKNTGLVLKVQSTEEGLYTFPTLPVGTYNIVVEKSGFKKLTRTDVPVNTAARVSLDLKLEVGDVTQSVDVTAEAPLLEATSSEKSSNFTPKFMANLPLFTGGIRSAQSFVGYMPGVNNNREMSISGSGGRGAEVQIDGASLIIPESGGAVFNFPGSEAFGEFKLTTGTYSAELGRFGGGVQQFSSKSGTNDFHGALFWYLRRDIFNANAWQNNAAGRARPKERFNEAGFAAGGPVWIPKVYDGRNKTFFYVTLSRDLRPATISPVQDTVPTAAMRSGNFAELGTLVYDPATTVGNTRQPFPGNSIPASRISKVASNFLPSLPSPNLGGFAFNYAFVNQSAVKDRVFTYKVDHNFSSNNRLAFFHTMQNQDTQNITAFDGPLGQGLGNNFQKPFNVRANHDLVIRPTILLHSTFGYSSTIQGWDNPAQRGFASKVGLGVPTDATPRVVFSSADAYTPWGVQDGKVNNGGQNNYTYHFNQTLSVLKGKHSMKFGWDIRRLQTYAFD
ncbi:MAG TPA: carboxypeptidase-like regulatory domain-containing protein, partial [Bryobacteraceae bacterium]|nr:carboxypeptidase-like regulatory domain-containing protein [Bryobacteraceae bacterium]